MNSELRQPARVLLSGASGMLGTALARALAGSGAVVCRLVRRPSTSPYEIQWDPTLPQPFHKPVELENFHAVIHLGGVNLAARRWSPAFKDELFHSRIDSTRALAQALAGLRQPPEVLLTASAIGIYGHRGDELLDESFPSGYGFLADLCRHWEAAAQPAVEASIRVAHLRTGLVLASEEGALAKLLPLFRLGLGGPLGSGRQWMSWIAREDWLCAVQFLLFGCDLMGAVNLSAPNPVTNSEFTRILAQALHRPAFLPAPAFALRLAVGPMADEALLASQRVLPRKLLEAGFQFDHPQLDTALHALLAQR